MTTTSIEVDRNGLVVKIADQSSEFDAVHRLNYETFVAEIPQHSPNESGFLVDRFHDENTYAVCFANGKLVGMVSGRSIRPFSLDANLIDLNRHLPTHRKAVEIRLLAVRREFRNTTVFVRLIEVLAGHFLAMGCDLAVISGTVRQLNLYRHLGFKKFAALIGTPGAWYQPMYLTLNQWKQSRTLTRKCSTRSAVASFLPGPVAISHDVKKAFAESPASHRDDEFASRMARVRTDLCRLAGAANVIVLGGSGTLANDAIAAQISRLGRKGLVLANGEFGERLIDHAMRWGLDCDIEHRAWGDLMCWTSLLSKVMESRPGWIWAVVSETSTGVENPLDQLRQLAESVDARLCVDAVSALGLKGMDLRGVWLASGVSGKGLAALPGLAMVFHDGRLADKGALPAYLDLATYQAASSVPFTLSSNLLAALDCALSSTNWADKFRLILLTSKTLHVGLDNVGLPPLARQDMAMPGIFTIPLSPEFDARAVGAAMAKKGIHLAYQSDYLRRRNWLQICLMGEFDQALAAKIPEILAAAVRGVQGTDDEEN